jgi:hypothetical protein
MAKRLVPTLPKPLRDAMPPEYLVNEAEYWQARDHLLAHFQGKWVAFHRGQVVAFGEDFVAVMDEAGQKGFPTAYIDKVGEEGTLEFRSRRVTFSYNQAYRPTALPQATVTFRNFLQSRQQSFTDVIPDTGSDLSALIEDDKDALDLLSGPHVPSTVRGVGGQSSLCVVCRAYAEIGGRQFAALVQVIAGQTERFLGREVLNQIVVTFDGPNGQVIFDV